MPYYTINNSHAHTDPTEYAEDVEEEHDIEPATMPKPASKPTLPTANTTTTRPPIAPRACMYLLVVIIICCFITSAV